MYQALFLAHFIDFSHLIFKIVPWVAVVNSLHIRMRRHREAIGLSPKWKRWDSDSRQLGPILHFKPSCSVASVLMEASTEECASTEEEYSPGQGGVFPDDGLPSWVE